MKKATRILALVLALIMVMATMAGCGDKTEGGSGDAAGSIAPLGSGKDIFKDEIKIAHVALSTAGITNELIHMGMEEQLLLYPNVKITYFDANYDVNTQISMVQEAVTQKFDCIIMEPLDTEACNKAIVEAEEAGIPVITVNTGATALHTLHLQGSDYAAGQISARELIKIHGSTGNAVVLDCPAEMKAIGLMGTGFEETVKAESDIVVLENQGVPAWQQSEARTIMSDMLTKYPDIDMVYCASDDIAMGAVQAIESAGREGILVWGNCGYRTGLDAIADGRMTGTCFSDVYVQYATATYMALMYISTGQTSITSGYTTTPIVDQVMTPVTIDNVENFKAISRWYVN